MKKQTAATANFQASSYCCFFYIIAPRSLSLSGVLYYSSLPKLPLPVINKEPYLDKWLFFRIEISHLDYGYPYKVNAVDKNIVKRDLNVISYNYVPHPLPCKVKIQYLLTSQLIRYYLLAFRAVLV